MNFSELMQRLASFPERSITFYGESNEVVSKPYPEVYADVQRIAAQLRSWGVKAGMRVGILASNSYAWVVYDLALLHLKVTSVAFPDEFGSKSSDELVEKYQLALLLVSQRDHWPATRPNEFTAYLDADNPPDFKVNARATTDATGDFIPSLTFSSGTAGKIKCLVTNLRGAEDTIQNFYELFDINGADSFLVFLPLSSFQQRLMIYAGFFYGFDILLVGPAQVFAAFKELRPTLCLAPPLLYETIHAQFNKAVRGLSLSRRAAFHLLSTLARVNLPPSLRQRLLNACYGKIYSSLGGRVRLMWTGMAPIKRATLDFFARLRLPLYEAYGLTECGAIATNTPAHNRRGSVGRPITDGSIHLAEDGEILVRQEHLQTTGYLECDAGEEARTYVAPGTVATGDIGRFDEDGYLYLVGRKKELIITGQGYKLHPEHLEALIDQCPLVERSVVFGNNLPYLVALVSIQEPRTAQAEARVNKSIEKINGELPPAARIARVFITTEQFTRESGLMTRNLKLDRRAIFDRFVREFFDGESAPGGAEQRAAVAAALPAPAQPGDEGTVAEVWREVLKVKAVGPDDNFFELGGNSLLMAQVRSGLRSALGREITLLDLFNYPTVRSLARHLSRLPRADAGPLAGLPAPAETLPAGEQEAARAPRSAEAVAGEGIAVIGMAGRFPGAQSVDQLWQNLCGGVESISFFSDEELRAASIEPAIYNHPHYVKAKPVLDGMEMFDAAFFGFNPREAEMMDPQHRVFLECAWEALENAGYDADTYAGSIGVYAGASLSTYVFNALTRLNGLESLGALQQLGIGNGLWSLVTRVSYKLNLRGPSVNVQTACSTSLSAVHLACQSLLDRQCDMALAGGVSIIVPNREGYRYEEGGIFSVDGHCRAFDANAQGTIVGDGVGLVVLKRLSQALADGDYIHAVIKGSAMNNDGALKAGFTAPSVDGQAEVIASALSKAGVTADSIGYVEAHGTGTQMGDPIEVRALTKTFRAGTDKKGYCALGSLKTNIGHLDTAAGVAGLIKAVLSLEHEALPPILNFERPNPQLDLENSPFYVNTELTEWKKNSHPRRAGVSSFGFGGTNVHVIVEEAAPHAASGPARPWQLLPLAAKTPYSLDAANASLIEHLKRNPQANLADIAYTYQVGRKAFRERQALVCRDVEDALSALEAGDAKRVMTATVTEAGEPAVAFMFPGQGSQHVNMASELYQTEPTFRAHVDACCELLGPHLGFDLREVIFPPEEESEEAAERLGQTAVTQPALFVIEYALARLWMEWGCIPRMMIGHSLGEYVAACLAGVFTLEEALKLVAVRGRLMQQLPGGAMLMVPLPEAEVRSHLGGQLSLAAVNAPSQCVVSGPFDAVERLEKELTAKGLSAHRLKTSHAFHSAMVEPILESFARHVAQAQPKPPQTPFVSNVTGDWITASEAVDPQYWAKHLRQAVRFADGLQKLLDDSNHLLLEVGPGQVLGSLAKRQAGTNARVLSSLRHAQAQHSDASLMLDALGKLWLAGVKVDWKQFNAHQKRQRVPVPSYQFERQYYWVKAQPFDTHKRPAESQKKADIADWFYVPSWKQSPLAPVQAPENSAGRQERWLIFADECGLGEKLAARLRAGGGIVVTVRPGPDSSMADGDEHVIDARQADAYQALLRTLDERGQLPTKVVHLWSVTPKGEALAGEASFEELQERGLYSLLNLAKSIGQVGRTTPLEIYVVSNNLHEVTGAEELSPGKATLLSPCKIIPQEYPHTKCRSIDITIPTHGAEEELIEQLLAECEGVSPDSTVAYRGRHRWVQAYEPLRVEDRGVRPPRLKEGGVYLIIGGFSSLGIKLAEYLAQACKARLVLTTNVNVPPREQWERRLTAGEQGVEGRQVRQAMALEALGATVLPVCAADADQAQAEAVARAVELFGEINGIIHTSDTTVSSEELARTVQDVEKADCEAAFRAKTGGLLALEKIGWKVRPDFYLFFSSISSVLGGLGLTAYTAANLFIDALARDLARRVGVRCTCVDLDSWRTEQELDQHRATGVGASLSALAIMPDEFDGVFARLFRAIGVPQVVVSTGDLQARIDQWIKLLSVKGSGSPNPVRGTVYPRSNLLKSYVAPNTDVERKVADIWQQLLGLEQVGADDDFFELGGNSLLATQLVTRLRDAFQVTLPLRSFFETPTVAQLAAAIEKAGDRVAESGTRKIKRIPRESLRVSRASLKAEAAAR